MKDRVTFEIVDLPNLPVMLRLTMPDGRLVDMQPTGQVSRREASIICGAMLNCMRAGLRADQFRHGEVLKERVAI